MPGQQTRTDQRDNFSTAPGKLPGIQQLPDGKGKNNDDGNNEGYEWLASGAESPRNGGAHILPAKETVMYARGVAKAAPTAGAAVAKQYASDFFRLACWGGCQTPPPTFASARLG